MRHWECWSDGTPLPTPPPWEEQEWCDGATCEHESCYAAYYETMLAEEHAASDCDHRDH